MELNLPLQQSGWIAQDFLHVFTEAQPVALKRFLAWPKRTSRPLLQGFLSVVNNDSRSNLKEGPGWILVGLNSLSLHFIYIIFILLSLIPHGWLCVPQGVHPSLWEPLFEAKTFDAATAFSKLSHTWGLDNWNCKMLNTRAAQYWKETDIVFLTNGDMKNIHKFPPDNVSSWSEAMRVMLHKVEVIMEWWKTVWQHQCVADAKIICGEAPLTTSDKTYQSRHLLHAALYLQTASEKDKIIFWKHKTGNWHIKSPFWKTVKKQWKKSQKLYWTREHNNIYFCEKYISICQKMWAMCVKEYKDNFCLFHLTLW